MWIWTTALLALTTLGLALWVWSLRRVPGDLYTWWSGYRIGDMVRHEDARIDPRVGRKFHYDRYPHSIASEYMRSTDESCDWDAIVRIIERRALPDEHTCVVHLRLGDIVERMGRELDQMLETGIDCPDGVNYAKPLSYYTDRIPRLHERGVKRIVLVGGSHVRLPAYPRSNAYLAAIAELFREAGFDVQLRIAGNPDDDLVYISGARTFIRSGGGFSEMAEEVVRRRGGESI